MPVTPRLLGTKAFLDFPIQDVINYIDWNPFFQVTLQCSLMDMACCFCGPVCMEHR